MRHIGHSIAGKSLDPTSKDVSAVVAMSLSLSMEAGSLAVGTGGRCLLESNCTVSLCSEAYISGCGKEKLLVSGCGKETLL